MSDMQYDNLVFLDTETTGTDEQDRICQVAYNFQGKEYNELFKPPLAISVEAMAVSHITNKMVADKEPFEGSEMQAHLKQLLEEENHILVAHNAQFDLAMLAKDEVSTSRYIDTLKVAQYLDPEGVIPRYGMQYLRYYLDIDIAPEEAPAHNALGDIRVLIKLFDRLYEKMLSQEGEHKKVIDKMMEISKLPVCIKRFSFGKYKDKLVAQVALEDKGYLEWLQKQKQEQRAQGNPDEDWEYTLQHYLH
ncbi:MAG: exonuclease domain-containing protein [Patescibacteria group bacterium]